jgi:hypothetical protein
MTPAPPIPAVATSRTRFSWVSVQSGYNFQAGCNKTTRGHHVEGLQKTLGRASKPPARVGRARVELGVCRGCGAGRLVGRPA